MRKEYRKALRERFAESLARDFPDLESVKVESPILWGGESVFRWAPGSAHGFVLLVPSPQGHESYTIELAWSARGRFPEVSSRPSIMLGPEDSHPIDVEEGVVRIGGLVTGNDIWWELPNPPLEKPGSMAALQWSVDPLPTEEAVAAVAQRLPETLALVREVGVPFLEAVLSRLGGQAATLRRAPGSRLG